MATLLLPKLRMCGNILFSLHNKVIAMSYLLTIGLLICSNLFMAFAWYRHLKLAENVWFGKLLVFGAGSLFYL